ncbi:uncharacterized protein V1518DRAFT_421327 [Limtongia smithiae]|uniref:uncharacterized protein n=1 Tax=Limtongia smithiae TaxID=1125753 RepID=UPI0034D001B3
MPYNWPRTQRFCSISQFQTTKYEESRIMSGYYNNNNGGYPQQNQYGNNQQYPYGQQGNQQYPQQGYPQHQQSQYPQQQQYQQYPQQQGQYGQQYPQQQQQGQYPPQGYPSQQQGQYGHYQGQQQGYPPQQLQQQQYAPPPYASSTQSAQQYTIAPEIDPHYDPSNDVQILIKATKGFGTDEKAVVGVLGKKTPAQIETLKPAFERVAGKSLRRVLEKETRSGSHFQDALLQIISGPLAADVENVNKALKGVGTKECMLNDIILSRTNAELNAIKGLYQQRFNKSLDKEVADDLSMKTKQMFAMVLTANRVEEWIPVDPSRVQQDVQDLYRATQGKIGTDELLVCSILTNRSDNQIRAIADAYYRSHNKKLVAVIEKEFSGHMKSALLHIVKSAVNHSTYIAELLEKCMAGAGTKDYLLIERVVRLHWNPMLVAQVKQAYRNVYSKDLISRIRGETSGDYEKILVAMLQ